MTQPRRTEVRGRILSSARELFRTYGVRAVTMSAVAQHADCSRQLLYKVFFDRREVILAAAVERIREIADSTTADARRPAATGEPFATSFVELSITVIEALRNDSELAMLLGQGSPVTMHEALWAPELTDRALDFWQPWLDSGRRQRVLRDDVPNGHLADWLHTVFVSMILRRNVPRSEERAMIERFVVTSLAVAGRPVTP